MMKKNSIVQKLIVTFLFASIYIISFGQTTTWTGTLDNLWTEASNWTNGVPDETNDVIIATSANHPILTQMNVKAKSLYIQSGAELWLQNGASLNITPQNSIGVLNEGTMDIDGILDITASDPSLTNELQNDGICTNNGTITTNGNIVSTTSINGQGVFELEENWEYTGSANLEDINVLFKGVNDSNINHSTELYKLTIEKDNAVVKILNDLTIIDEVQLISGKVDLNANIIQLLSNASVSGENEASYFYDSEGSGLGYIQYSTPINNQTGVTMGNLGLIVSSIDDLGIFTLKRRHYNQVGAISIVNRTYEVSHDNPLGTASLSLHYLDHELEGLTESNIGLFIDSPEIFSGINNEKIMTAHNEETNMIVYDTEIQSGEIMFSFSNRQTIWIGNVSDNWETHDNWNVGSPNFLYHAFIPEPIHAWATVYLNHTVICRSLTLEEGIVDNRGNIIIQGPSEDGLKMGMYSEFFNNPSSTITISVVEE